METIYCPYCGAPVMIRGSQWECGYCGDCGSFSSLPSSEQKKIVRAALDERLYKLKRSVFSILQGVKEGVGDGKKEMTLAYEMSVYGISRSLIRKKNQTRDNLLLLEYFFQTYTFATADEILLAARSGKPAFEEAFLLSRERLGSFWISQLPGLPIYTPVKMLPNWIDQILDGLSEMESLFSGVDCIDAWETLRDALVAHWSIYPVTHPNYAVLEDMVRRWDFGENEWASRDLLIAAFPEAVRRWTPEELLEMLPADLMLYACEEDPATALSMAQLLLNTAQEHLQDEDVVYELFEDDLYELFLQDDFLRLLTERLKEDERLAVQLFGSAYVDMPQESVLEACDVFGEPELKNKLLALLEKNPCFEGFD